jgi:hypothetical protein
MEQEQEPQHGKPKYGQQRRGLDPQDPTTLAPGQRVHQPEEEQED